MDCACSLGCLNVISRCFTQFLPELHEIWAAQHLIPAILTCLLFALHLSNVFTAPTEDNKPNTTVLIFYEQRTLNSIWIDLGGTLFSYSGIMLFHVQQKPTHARINTKPPTRGGSAETDRKHIHHTSTEKTEPQKSNHLTTHTSYSIETDTRDVSRDFQLNSQHWYHKFRFQPALVGMEAIEGKRRGWRVRNR